MNGMRMNRRRSEGFTLLELLAVLALMGMLGLVVTVNLQSLLPSVQLKSAARRISSILKTARSQAVITDHTYFVEYNRENGSVEIRPFTPSSDTHRAGKSDEENEDGAVRQTYYLPAEVQFEELNSLQDQSETEARKQGGTFGVLVHTHGFIQPHAIQVSNEEGTRLQIVPNPVTGEISIRDPSTLDEIVLEDRRQ